MGGKVWSDAEERYFWRTAMSFSPKRVGIDRVKPEVSWPQLATQMQSAMGGEARRQYTETMMFEHYFQNIESQRVSPNAVLYVYEYNIKKGRDEDTSLHPHSHPHPQSQTARTPRHGKHASPKGNTADDGKSRREPRRSPSPTAATAALVSSPKETAVQQTETGLKAQRDDRPSSGGPSPGPRGPALRPLGRHRKLHSYHPYARVPAPASPSPVFTGGRRSTGTLSVRRLPYAPDRDSQHTMRMPSSRFWQPPESGSTHPNASLDYDRDEVSERDEGETLERDEDEALE